jgi:hypothetical protein
MRIDPGPAGRLGRLRLALQAVGDALARPALDQLIAAEAALAAAVADLPPFALDGLTPEARVHLLEDIAASRAALARCRRLGGTLGAVVQATLAVQGRDGGYDRLGGERVAAPAGGFGARG